MSQHRVNKPNRARAGTLSCGVPALFGLLLFCAMPVNALAGAYTPKDDAVVLERLPAAAELKALTPLRQRLAQHPDDGKAAFTLAERYIGLNRKHADPRFLGYAEATLQPWLSQPQPPPRAMLLEATILQSRHHFRAALDLLDKTLHRAPGYGQALLTKATVLRVRGRLRDARRICARLTLHADALVAMTCLEGVQALNGQLPKSYADLNAAAQLKQPKDKKIRLWLDTELGEMAERLGRDAAAQAHFRAGLKRAPGNIYLQAAYADLLLRAGRNHDVIDLLKDNERQDVLLMRLAIAGKRAGDPRAGRWADMFENRFAAARRDGNHTHLREQARFMLAVRNRPKLAAKLARADWKVQHEPGDVLVVLDAARAAHAPELAQPVRDWIRRTGYQDARLRHSDTDKTSG